jgi:hypothetical protein
MEANIQLSYAEIKDALKNDGSHVSLFIEGEPGIGKSAIGADLAAELGYNFVYMDMANMSLGDLMYPVPDRDRGCMVFYPNEIFRLHENKPAVIMLDEWTKASKEVKNMTLPLVHPDDRRIGSTKVHPESIVFATGNMTRDGVGDSIQAHQRNRFVPVSMRKPSADEWINNYAINHSIEPTVIAFVDQFPAVMESYIDDKDGKNEYIFNPKKQQASYASPRSLKFASDMIKTRAGKTEATLHAELVGAIGRAAAADLVNFVRMNEELPPFASILADPLHCSIPNEPTNKLLLTFSLIVRSDKANIVPLVKYMERFNNEMQALFFNKLLSTQSKAGWAALVPEVGKRVSAIHHVF